MGVSVTEISSDTMIATDSVTANSRNRRPGRPPMNSMGMKTATSETLIATTVNPTSRAPRMAARSGGTPFSR